MPEVSDNLPPSDPGEGTATADGDVPRDRIVDLEIDRELHDSYLTYAMSTIMDRALPDVRDGLKPSQRRILVAMHDLNLTHGRKHIECAKIAGDTSNYHPHGESVIYPTLVNMGQDWKTRTLLVDKQGNFGSIEEAPRDAIHQARMTHATIAMLEDIKSETVDFDRTTTTDSWNRWCCPPSSRTCSATDRADRGRHGLQHAPAQRVRGLHRDHRGARGPDIDVQGLLEIMPGPDSPPEGRSSAAASWGLRHRTWSGHGPRQGPSRGTEGSRLPGDRGDPLPGGPVEPAGEARDRGGQGRTDPRHREHPQSLRPHRANPHPGRAQRGGPLGGGAADLPVHPPAVHLLDHQHRPGQQPTATLSVKQLIQCWIDHRREVIRRRTEYLLRRARQDAHKLEGKIYAVCDIEEVIKLIRASKTREEAIRRLQERAFRIPPDHEHAGEIPSRLIEASNEGDGVLLTHVQAEAIGALRLIQLVGLEIETLTAELRKLHDEIEDYESILASEERVRGMIRDDCREIAERFGDDRRTTIEEGDADDLEIESLIQEHDVVVTISHEGYVKRLPVDTYRSQGRGGTGIRGSQTKEDDFVEHVFVSTTHTDLMCFTNTSQVFRMKVWQIPEMGRTSRGDLSEPRRPPQGGPPVSSSRSPTSSGPRTTSSSPPRPARSSAPPSRTTATSARAASSRSTSTRIG